MYQHRCLLTRPLHLINQQIQNLPTNSFRCIILSDLPTFDKSPIINIPMYKYNANINILTLSHWVDIQYFDQNKLGYNTLYSWIESISPTHILLDICPNRLNYIYNYNISNPKPLDLTNDDIDTILENIRDGNLKDIDINIDDYQYYLNENEIRQHFYKLRKQNKLTNKMNRFNEKVARLDEIYKFKLIRATNKVKANNKILNSYKLTEPIFNDIDIWYFELFWSFFEKYYKSLIPHFDEFKKEFYLNTNKFRWLNIIYGEEIMIAVDYFNDNQFNIAADDMYQLPKIKGIHSRNEFDKYMDTILDSDYNNQLIKIYNNNSIKLIAGGIPIEFILRKIQKLKKPMLWIEFAMSIKNYFTDKHMQNLANQIPLICDLKEFLWTPHARNLKNNSWDSTIELSEMIYQVIPQFYDILLEIQPQYLYNNLINVLNDNNDNNDMKNILIITGQGVAHKLSDKIISNKDLNLNKQLKKTINQF